MPGLFLFWQSAGASARIIAMHGDAVLLRDEVEFPAQRLNRGEATISSIAVLKRIFSHFSPLNPSAPERVFISK